MARVEVGTRRRKAMGCHAGQWVKAELVLAAIQVLERMWNNFELGIRRSR
jgi:hypothetical protein